MLDDVKLAELYTTTVLNERIDILRGQTYSDLSYIFSGGQDPTTPGSTPLVFGRLLRQIKGCGHKYR